MELTCVAEIEGSTGEYGTMDVDNDTLGHNRKEIIPFEIDDSFSSVTDPSVFSSKYYPYFAIGAGLCFGT